MFAYLLTPPPIFIPGLWLIARWCGLIFPCDFHIHFEFRFFGGDARFLPWWQIPSPGRTRNRGVLESELEAVCSRFVLLGVMNQINGEVILLALKFINFTSHPHLSYNAQFLTSGAHAMEQIEKRCWWSGSAFRERVRSDFLWRHRHVLGFLHGGPARRLPWI